MPLPSVQGYMLGTRQPMSYVEPALQAYLQVSQEMRARHQQMMSDLDQGQQQFLRGQENIRRGESHEQDMIDAEVNRGLRIEGHQMDVERHGAFMAQAGIELEAMQYDRDVVRPLRTEMDRLRLGEARFNLQAAQETERVRMARIGEFDAQFQGWQSVYRGQAQIPDASVVDGTVSTAEDFGNHSGFLVKSNGMKAGQVYWNHNLGRPFIAHGVKQDTGEVQMLGPGGVKLEGEANHRWTPIRPISKEQVPAPDALGEFFQSVTPPESPDILAGKDRVRAAKHYLDTLRTAFGDIPGARLRMEGAESILKSDPYYQLAVGQGEMMSPWEIEQRRNNRDTHLRLVFGGDSEFDGWKAQNPSLFGSLMSMPDDQFDAARKTIETQRKEAASNARPSPKIADELRRAEIEVMQARAKVEAAKSSPIGAINLPTYEAELNAAEQAANYLRGLGGSTAPANPTIEAAKGYFSDAP